MSTKNSYRITVLVFLGIALASLIYKGIFLSEHLVSFYPQDKFSLDYRFYFRTNQDEETNVRSYLPQSNERQRITLLPDSTDAGIDFKTKKENGNLRGVWTTSKSDSYNEIQHRFTFEGKERKFEIPESFQYSSLDSTYLASTNYIQVDHPKIDSLAKSISSNYKSDRQRVAAIFEICSAINAAPITTRTDAVTALEQNRASCNGKTRLFVALARNLGYPARMQGGIILEDADKRTSHAWAELYDGKKWISFDALNDHYAIIPSNYMEIQHGDDYLLSYTKDIEFDYIYEIQERSHIPFLKITPTEFTSISPVTLWNLVESDWITKQPLLLLLMLPLGGLIVAFLRNVVGLKTFGVFLPVLIAFALFETGFWLGMLLFMTLILLVGILARPFDRFGLLHTPKLVVSLTLMVLVMTAGSYIGYSIGIKWLSLITIFPTIILTISAERFSNIIIEEDFKEAVWMLGQTLLAVCICYLILQIKWLSSLVIIFPEVLLLIIGTSLLMGRYMGMRWTEFIRFSKLLGNQKTAHA